MPTKEITEMITEIHSNKYESSNHSNLLLEDIERLYVQKENCDVELELNGECIPAHKIILASRSEYFKALFYGGLKETSQKKIQLIENTSSESFQSVLEYIYTGRLRFGDKTKNHLIDLQILSNKYALLDLEKSIIDYIAGSVLSIENACEFYNFADRYKIDELRDACNSTIYENPEDFLKSGDIKFLSAEIFGRIVSNDTFIANEKDIFFAAKTWLDDYPQTTEQDRSLVLDSIRLSRLSRADLLEIVRPTKLFPPDVILDVLSDKEKGEPIHHRYKRIYNVNLATTSQGARLICGKQEYVKDSLKDVKDNLFAYTKDTLAVRSHSMYCYCDIGTICDCETTKYSGYTYHDSSSNTGITVDLGNVYSVNCIQVLLQKCQPAHYAYYVETSLDHERWERLVDHSKEKCASWQNIDFEEKLIRLIRIIGTESWPKNLNLNGLLHIVAFKVFNNK